MYVIYLHIIRFMLFFEIIIKYVLGKNNLIRWNLKHFITIKALDT